MRNVLFLLITVFSFACATTEKQTAKNPKNSSTCMYKEGNINFANCYEQNQNSDDPTYW